MKTLTQRRRTHLQFDSLEDRRVMSTTPLPRPILTAAQVSAPAKSVQIIQPVAVSAPTPMGAVAPPATAVLIGPTGTVTQTAATFRWHAARGASHYQLYVQNLRTGVVHFNQWVTSTAQTVGGLSAGHYRFLVRTWGNGVVGAWSNTLHFNVAPQPVAPGTPVVHAPSGTISGVNPTFTWSAVPRASHYRLYVVNVTQNHVAIDRWVQATSFTHIGKLTPGHVYRVWVHGWGNGVAGAWSAVKEFRIQPTVETAAQPITPNGIQTGARPLFRWTAVPQASYYRLLVYHIDSGVMRINYVVVSNTQLQPSFDLPKGKYRWNVETYFASGRGVNSGTATFTVV